MKKLIIATLAFAAATTPAFAHLDPATHGSFAAGFSHPLFGLDHILAMIAVGVWAATLGRRAMLMVPTAFVGTMALGFALALAGVGLPFVEPVILASVIAVGILIALALPVSMGAVAATVAFFALFHGSAHGAELGAAGATQFALGFIVATALLHVAGIGLGMALNRIKSATLLRAAGGATALAGLWLAFAG